LYTPYTHGRWIVEIFECDKYGFQERYFKEEQEEDEKRNEFTDPWSSFT
jgi:hypothetical protein